MAIHSLASHAHGDKGHMVIETELGPIAPCAGLNIEWPGKGCREERAFSLTFCQIVALVLPHRSVFAGLLLVAILFLPLLNWNWLSHGKRRAKAHLTEET